MKKEVVGNMMVGITCLLILIIYCFKFFNDEIEKINMTNEFEYIF